MARRVPLRAGSDDLRRKRRDPAQHHRPANARPGGGPAIAGEELEIFLGSLRHATARHTGEALDDALDELAWREALAADRHAAVSTLFELQGATNATSSALYLVVATALGVDPAERAG